MRYKKQFMKLFIAFSMLSSCLVGCSAKEEVQQVKVGTWKTAQTIQPFFYEQFLPEEIKVEVLPFTNPGDQKTALLAEEVTMTGTTLVTAITAASQGEPIKIVASLCNKCSALVVGKDSGIEKLEDLRGKKIAYVPGTMHHALLLEVLSSAFLSEEEVELIQIDFFDMGLALQNGDIDAFLSGEPYPSEAVLAGYGRVLMYPYFEEGIGTINAAMIVTKETIENDRELVQTLVNAHIQATTYIKDHTEEWYKKAEAFGTKKEVMEIASKNIELCYEIDETYLQNAQELAVKMKELGMIETIPNMEELFDTSFIK